MRGEPRPVNDGTGVIIEPCTLHSLEEWAVLRHALWPDAPVQDHRSEAAAMLWEQRKAVAFLVRLPDGSMVSGLNVNNAATGQQVTACVRPERIRLHTVTEAANEATSNSLPATVSDLIYFGDHVRVRCTLPKQEDCFVKLALNDAALPQLHAGTPVRLGIEPERLRVFH